MERQREEEVAVDKAIWNDVKRDRWNERMRHTIGRLFFQSLKLIFMLLDRFVLPALITMQLFDFAMVVLIHACQ